MRPGRLTALALMLLYLGVGVFDHEIWAPTETTVSGIVWYMLDSGDLVVPRINGLAYLEKPPLYYWTAWAAGSLGGGLTPGLLRLPAALFALLALFALHRTLRLRHDPWTASAATLLVGTTVTFYELGHRASTDVAATSATFVCFALFARTLEGDPKALRFRDTVGWDVVFSLALALSFFAKNFYTLFIVVPPVLVMLAWRREWRRALFMGAVGSVALVVLVGPWVYALYEAGGTTFLRVVFFDNTLGRFLVIDDPGFDPGPLNDAFVAEKEASLSYYLERVPVVLAPWSLLVGLGALQLWRQRPLADLQRFTALGLVIPPLLLTLSSSKVTEYVTPVIFFGGLAMAEWLGASQEASGRRRFERALAIGSLAVVGLACILAPGVLGVMRGEWGWLVVPPVLAALAWSLAAGFRPPGPRPEAWGRALLGLALGLALTLAAAIPLLDARKSYAPFFEVVRREAEGRRVVTTLEGDHSLPLITYYLDRRVELLEWHEAMTLLSGPEPVAAILRARAYDEAPERVDGIPGVRVSEVRGRRKLVLALNGQGAPGEAP